MCFFRQILSLLHVLFHVILIYISHSLDRNNPSSAFHQEIIHLLSSLSHDGISSTPVSPINQRDFTRQPFHSQSHSLVLTAKSVTKLSGLSGLSGLPDDPIEEEDGFATNGVDGSKKIIHNAVPSSHYHTSQIHQATVLRMDSIESTMESVNIPVCLSEEGKLVQQNSQKHRDCALQVTDDDEREWLKKDEETKPHDNRVYELHKEELEEENAFLAFIEHGENEYEQTSFPNKHIREETETGVDIERNSSNSESPANKLSPSPNSVIQTTHSFRIVPNTIDIQSVPKSNHHSHIYQVRDIGSLIPE